VIISIELLLWGGDDIGATDVDRIAMVGIDVSCGNSISSVQAEHNNGNNTEFKRGES
jgi:hypothetical protein